MRGFEAGERARRLTQHGFDARQPMLDVGDVGRHLVLASAIASELPGAIKDGGGKGETSADDQNGDEVSKIHLCLVAGMGAPTAYATVQPVVSGRAALIRP